MPVAREVERRGPRPSKVRDQERAARGGGHLVRDAQRQLGFDREALPLDAQRIARGEGRERRDRLVRTPVSFRLD